MILFNSEINPIRLFDLENTTLDVVSMVSVPLMITNVDSGGVYVFENLEPGVYLIAAETSDNNLRVLSGSIELGLGEELEVPHLVITTLGQLLGKASLSSVGVASGIEV